MKILFLDQVHSSLKYKLTKKGFICEEDFDSKKKLIEKIIKDYEGIVIRSRFKIDKSFLNLASNLKFIARAGSGLENIDLKYAKKKNISCINAAEGNSQAVAEHAVGMLLCLLNNINKSHNEIKKGFWKREENRGVELNGKTVGIIGYGNTGSCFAKILQGFDVKILAFDKYKQAIPFESSMQEIFSNSDIISLHIPLTKETKNLINSSFISKAHKPFYLINTSRGKCIDTNILIQGIKEKKIIGACLDVLSFEKNSFENLSSHSKNLMFLQNSERVILSPHIAGWTHESNKKIASILFKKILRLYD